MSWTHVPSEFNDENAPSCYSIIVIHLVTFCTKTWKCMLQRESFEEIATIVGLIVKVLLTLGLHAVFIEYCKIYG